jgi:hypothetical protein
LASWAHRTCLLASVGLLAVAAGTGTVASATSSRSAATAGKALTLYTVATAEQFLNESDDRARGEGNNPFGSYADTPAIAEQSSNGPFAGDEAFFQFSVYSDAALTQKAGSATYVCVYNFNKNGFCDATFTLNHGSLLTEGLFNFNTASFKLAVTGGTGSYVGAKGAVDETPAANHSQRMVFTLK